MALKKKYQQRLRSIPFEFEKIDGTVVTYTLRELMGDSRDVYLNSQRARTKQTGDGSVQITDYSGIMSSLLALCIYDENEQLIPPNVIQTWPASMQDDLFKEATELSGLKGDMKKTEDEVKNGSKASNSPG